VVVIVIDGYNVLKQVDPSSSGNDRKRGAFVAQLGAYAAKRKHYLVVVFDGGPYDRAYREHQDGIEVVYSGAAHTADEYICNYMTRRQNVELLLVSSDHELCMYADRLDFVSIDSCYFYRIVQDTLRASVAGNQARYHKTRNREQAIKLHHDTSPELDAYMYQAVHDMVTKDKERSQSVRSTKRDEVTRRERRLLNILKKL